MWTFIVTPTVSFITTVFFTFVDIQVRSIQGLQARAPIVEFSFDKKRDEKVDKMEKEGDFNEDAVAAVEA